MAKYRIDPALIADLTTLGVIDGSGNITLMFPCRPAGQPDRWDELTFHATNDIIETANRRCQSAIENAVSPISASGGTTYIGRGNEPSLFVSVSEGDPNPTVDPVLDGTEVVSMNNKKLLKRYERDSGVSVPTGRNKAALDSYVAAAKNFYGLA